MGSFGTSSNSRYNRSQEQKAALAADSGVQYVLAQFASQAASNSNTGTTGTQTVATSTSDFWATLGNKGAEEFKVGDTSFRIEVQDACSRVDISQAGQDQLNRMPLSAEQVDSLLDYQEQGQSARQEGGKDDFYNGLTVPYNTKLGKIQSVDELLQVKGFTPLTLYGPSSQSPVAGNSGLSSNLVLVDIIGVGSLSKDVSPQGQTKQSIRQVTVQNLTQAGLPNQVAQAIFNLRTTATTMRAVVSVPGINAQQAATILDRYTLDGAATHPGRINVNTASQDVLSTLPNVPDDLASTLFGRQSTALNSWDEFRQVSGVTLAVIQQLADTITFTSSTFIVRVVGTAGSMSRAYEYLIRTDGTSPKVVRIDQPPFEDMDVRWNWDPVSNTVDLETQS